MSDESQLTLSASGSITVPGNVHWPEIESLRSEIADLQSRIATLEQDKLAMHNLSGAVADTIRRRRSLQTDKQLSD